MTFEALVYQGLIGLSLAMYLWLLAAGLTIAFGVLGVVNFAHGSLYMLGGYFAFTFYHTLQMNFWLSLLLAASSGAVIGMIMERFFLRYIYHLDLAYQILLTFGFVLIFADAAQDLLGRDSVDPADARDIRRDRTDRRPSVSRSTICS